MAELRCSANSNNDSTFSFSISAENDTQQLLHTTHKSEHMSRNFLFILLLLCEYLRKRIFCYLQPVVLGHVA